MSLRLSRCSIFAAGLVVALGGGLWGCFDGIGAVGAVCFADTQCGVGQGCVNSVCGLCNDREVQAGELCFGVSSEENVFGEVTDLVAFDKNGDGLSPKLVAIVNNNCQQPPNAGPPTENGPDCWGVYELEPDGDGDFEVTTRFGTTNPGYVPQIAAGDFDGSGTRDVAIAIRADDDLIDPSQLVILHDFDTPSESPPLELDISLQPRSIYAADMDGDGLDDVVIGGQVSSSLTILIATPGVGFENERLLITDPSPRPAAPVDMDNDGDLDVVLLSETERTVGVDLNNGAGFLSPQDRLVFQDPLVMGARPPVDLATADFDQDGNVDVVVFVSAPYNQNTGSDPILPEVQVYRGLGDGSLELQHTLPGGERPVSGLAEDVNHDGWPDIVVADILEDKLPVHINRNGSFPDIVTIDVAASPQVLMYADFDDDGIPDLVVGNANGVVAVVPSEN